MPKRYCQVSAYDKRGFQHSVTVEASSMYEAAALGFEKLSQRECWFDKITVSVLEPGRSLEVRPGKWISWLSRTAEDDPHKELKERIIKLMRKGPNRPSASDVYGKKS